MKDGMPMQCAARFILAVVLALCLTANHVPFGVDAADGPHRIVKKPITYEYIGLTKSMSGKWFSFSPNAPTGLACLMFPIFAIGLSPIRRLRSCLSQMLRRILLSNMQFSANYL